MRYNTILFDLDGTLIDTNTHIINALTKALKDVAHIHKTSQEIAETFGIPLRVAVRDMTPNHWEEVMTTYHKYSNAAGHDDVTLFPGVPELLQDLYDADYKLAIVTSRNRYNAIGYLEHFGIDHFFSRLISPEDCPEHKPNPAPVTLALKVLDAKPEEAIMIGDSPFDIMAAKGANIASVGVSYTAIGVEKLAVAEPDYMIDHILELKEILTGSY